MIYESPRYSAKTIVQGYMASQEAGHDSQFHMRINSFLQTLKKHAKHLPLPGSKVLDIGTAGGAFLNAAEQFGYDAYGMEPSADLVARGKSRGLNIEQGTIENHSFEYGSFDMVCLWDVIEHLPDPKLALVEIRKLLKPKGTLLINFPDIGTWQAKFAGKRFWWILSVHLHHFTRATISDICLRTGFQAFHYQRYWQTLEFGYLEQMAVHYKIPFAALIARLTPRFIQNTHTVLRQSNYGPSKDCGMTTFILGAGPTGMATADGLIESRRLRRIRKGTTNWRFGANFRLARSR